MRELEFTRDELVLMTSLIEDVVIFGEDVSTGGMHTGNIYITPYTCHCCANAIKKINEYLYENPTLYKKAYNKLKKNSQNK